MRHIPSAFAETRTISWDPVTTYTDGTPIEAGSKVNYTVYWTTDPGLGSLHTIGTSLATNSTTFDPDVQGMTRGGTVYFTAKAALSAGGASELSHAYRVGRCPGHAGPGGTDGRDYHQKEVEKGNTSKHQVSVLANMPNRA